MANAFVPNTIYDLSSMDLRKTITIQTTAVNSTGQAGKRTSVAVGSFSIPFLPAFTVEFIVSGFNGVLSYPQDGGGYTNVGYSISGTSPSLETYGSFSPGSLALDEEVFHPSVTALSMSVGVFHEPSRMNTVSNLKLDPFTITLTYFNIGWATA